jgi:hypothetical protein
MTTLSKTQRKELFRLIHWFCWRILPHSIYTNQLWRLGDVATIINREVGCSGTAVITEAQVKSMVLSKRIDGDGDDFIIVHLDGCTYPTRRRTDDVVPFRGTKKPIGTNGRDTIVFGWSSSDNLELPVGELSAASGRQLKVGEVEGDEAMVEELQSILGGGNGDTCNDENTAQNIRGPPDAAAAATAAAAGSAAGSAGSTGASSGGADGIGRGRTPPPPSSGTNGGATRRISPVDESAVSSRKRERQGSTTKQSHVYHGGRYYSISGEAIAPLLDLLRKFECEEISPPRDVVDDADNDGDDGDGDGIGNGTFGKPLKFQRIGAGRQASDHLIPTSHSLLRVRDVNELQRLRQLEKTAQRQLFSVGGGGRFNGGDFHRRLIALGAVSAPKASGEVLEMMCSVVRAGITVDLIEGGLKVPTNYSLQDIARASPSRTSITRWIYDLAADVVTENLRRLKAADPIMLCLVGDGGHRGGIEHYPKLIQYYEDSSKTVVAVTLDNYSCGKKASDVAMGGPRRGRCSQTSRNSLVPLKRTRSLRGSLRIRTGMLG